MTRKPLNQLFREIVMYAIGGEEKSKDDYVLFSLSNNPKVRYGFNLKSGNQS